MASTRLRPLLYSRMASAATPLRPFLTSRCALAPRTLGRRQASSAIPVPKPLHLLLYTYTEDALERRAPHRAAHLAVAADSVHRGELVLGGALAEPLDGGVLAFAGGRGVAERFAEADPYVVNGIVTDWTVREWTVVTGSLFAQLPSPPPFVATYEWQPVRGDAELPAGLDVELPLDGSTRKARIPEHWQLSVWCGPEVGFWRHNEVTRDTTVRMLREHAAARLGVAVERVALRLGDGDALDDARTAEELSLFGRAGEVVVEVRE